MIKNQPVINTTYMLTKQLNSPQKRIIVNVAPETVEFVISTFARKIVAFLITEKNLKKP